MMAAINPKAQDPTRKDLATTFGTEWPLMANSTVMQAWTQIGAETVRFVSDRLQQDIKAQKAMLACTSLDELRMVQADFFRATQDQYAAHGQRMMEIVGKAATIWPNPATGSGKLAYDDVPV
jgi:Phasin protein